MNAGVTLIAAIPVAANGSAAAVFRTKIKFFRLYLFLAALWHVASAPVGAQELGSGNDIKELKEVVKTIDIEPGELHNLSASIGYISCPGVLWSNTKPIRGVATVMEPGDIVVTALHIFLDIDRFPMRPITLRDDLDECVFRKALHPNEPVKVLFSDPATKRGLWGYITFADPRYDYVFLKIEHKFSRFIKLTDPDEVHEFLKRPSDRRRVVNIASAPPEPPNNQAVTGVLANLNAQICTVREQQTAAPLGMALGFSDCAGKPGMSGSPILSVDNKKMKLIGILVSGRHEWWEPSPYSIEGSSRIVIFSQNLE